MRQEESALRAENFPQLETRPVESLAVIPWALRG